VGDIWDEHMSSAPEETALVLSGGGAYGAFAIGVMKALFAGRSPVTRYRPLSAELFTGTSVGAFNAAMMSMQSERDNLASVLHLENVWLEFIANRPGRCGNGVFRLRGNPADLVNPNCLGAELTERLADDAFALGSYLLARTGSFFASSAALEERAMALVNIGSFIDSSPFRELLENCVNEEAIRQSHKRLKIPVTNWVTGKARYFDNSDFDQGRGISLIMASAAIPGIFPPVRIDREIYVDGGLVENTPLNSAIVMGAVHIHVVYLDPKPSVVRLRGEPYTIDTMMRVYEIMLAAKISEDIETASWINAGLNAVAAYQQDQAITETKMRDLIRTVGEFLKNTGRRYRPLLIHRYFPEAVLGGDLGMLDFRVDALARMIEEGERVASLHNCEESGCLTN
jgi:predicted acylesterase/phospholipase RssA